MVEEKVNSVIQSAAYVRRTKMSSNDLNQIDVTLVPGEVYPDDEIYVINMYNTVNDMYISREACCGTHIHNTLDVIDFCIIQYKCVSNECTLMALTGPMCMDTRIRGENLLEQSNVVKNMVNSTNLNNISPEKVTFIYNLIIPVIIKNKLILDDYVNELCGSNKITTEK